MSGPEMQAAEMADRMKAADTRIAELEVEVERWRSLFGADSPEDGCISGAQGKVIMELNRDNKALRERVKALAAALRGCVAEMAPYAETQQPIIHLWAIKWASLATAQDLLAEPTKPEKNP